MEKGFTQGKKVTVIRNLQHHEYKDSFNGRILTLKDRIILPCKIGEFWNTEEEPSVFFNEKELELYENTTDFHFSEEWKGNYLCRGKVISDTDNGWIEGYLFIKNGCAHILQDDKDVVVHNICRKLSLLDFEGYEKDIVETEKGCGIVCFNVLNGRWSVEIYRHGYFRGYYYFSADKNENIEILGNTVDNPEILKERCGI